MTPLNFEAVTGPQRSTKVNRARFVHGSEKSSERQNEQIQGELSTQHKRMVTTLKTFEFLCGTKHPESR